MHPDDVDDATLANMERYGGSFIRALAICYRRADEDNRAALRRTFAEYFEMYGRMK
jgi:hypothetical protein